MSTAELKLKLFREIDLLEKSKLDLLYGALLSILNKEIDETSWHSLSKNQQKGIIDAIEDLNSSDGIDHNFVIDKYKSKYA